MTAIDRTAYPRPGARLTHEELDARYALTATNLAFIRGSTRGEVGRLMLAALLKARQDLGCFPAPDELHADTVTHLASQLGLTPSVWSDEVHKTKSLYRYQAAVRTPGPTLSDVAGMRLVRVVISTAHLDHDPANGDPDNLRALCQRCHLRHDLEYHVARRWITWRRRHAVGDLFLGAYAADVCARQLSRGGAD
jgi:hypothetical protein